MSQFTGGTIGNYSRLWLIITGGILLAVGAIMAITLGNIPFAGGTMVLTGGIMALVGIGLIVVGIIVDRRAASTDALLTSGTPGTATITGLTQTGMYMNENPQIRMQLLVSLPGQTPYATQHTEIVPMMLLGRLNSGAPLQVRVDPMNLNRVAIDWGSSGLGMSGLGGTMGGPVAMAAAPTMPGTTAGSAQDESLAQVQAAMAGAATGAAAPFSNPAQGNLTVEQLRNYLRASGLEAQARVDSMEDTGKTVGDESVYTMEMTLMIPGKQEQKLPKSAAMIPTAKKHKLFQGMTVPVKYEATNPNLLMVEWDKI
ncbi:MAG TPA: hypothetical protein VHM65_10155 [Candidatus Lustribacter sp.]|nr:hypothetical protein [Candidatus Lustribacter sp.]